MAVWRKRFHINICIFQHQKVTGYSIAHSSTHLFIRWNSTKLWILCEEATVDYIIYKEACQGREVFVFETDENLTYCNMPFCRLTFKISHTITIIHFQVEKKKTMFRAKIKDHNNNLFHLRNWISLAYMKWMSWINENATLHTDSEGK